MLWKSDPNGSATVKKIGSVFLFPLGHRTLSDFFDRWPENLKIFRTILYGNVWECVIIVIVKVVKCPELFRGQQKHWSISSGMSEEKKVKNVKHFQRTILF